MRYIIPQGVKVDLVRVADLRSITDYTVRTQIVLEHGSISAEDSEAGTATFTHIAGGYEWFLTVNASDVEVEF